jgi:alginate O-acetyltransferase complex protein AlgI
MDSSIRELMTFNFYYDMQFWLAFLVIIIVFRFLSFNYVIRNVFLLVGSALMLLALPMFDFVSLFFLVAITSSVFAIVFFLNGETKIQMQSKRKIVAVIGILSVISILAFFKYTFIQDIISTNFVKSRTGVSHYIFIIGISYFSFKMIHVIAESYSQKISRLNYLSFLNYIFFFPAFISGPINRYNHFLEQLEFKKDNRLKKDLAVGIERIINGLFKKFVLCTIVYPYAIVNMPGTVADFGLYKILLGLYAYTFYFYFDFSGYSDIAIGSARIMGVELPENFNNPLMKKNIQQLWANWHMSLTKWLTDYVYWPLSKKLRNINYLRRRPVFLSNISIIVTFIICGIWHGESFNFAVWGCYHGIGLATLNTYQKQKRKTKNKLIRRYFLSKYSRFAGIVFTFHFFVFGLLLFSFQIPEIINLIMAVL